MKTSCKNRGKSKKTAKRVFDIFFYVVAAILFVVLLYGMVQRISGKDTISVFGYKLMVVATPSMSGKHPQYKDFLYGHDEQMQIDDLVVTRKFKAGELPELYSIVTFKDAAGRTVIHRIVEIRNENGITYYRTRGDANNGMDASRTAEDFNGIYTANLGQFGKVIKFIQSPYGIVAVTGCLFVVLAISLAFSGKKTEKTLVPDDEPESPNLG